MTESTAHRASVVVAGVWSAPSRGGARRLRESTRRIPAHTGRHAVHSRTTNTVYGCTLLSMTDREHLVAALEDAGVLAGIRWAFTSAVGHVADHYSEAAGHDATWAGVTRFVIFRDRLDRVFSCRRYGVPQGADGALSLDVLHEELSVRDIAALPAIEPGRVIRSNLNGSPGWAWGETRWLLASAPFGGLDQLPWPQKSPTKQAVAKQPNPDPDQSSLFDDLTEDETGGLVALQFAKSSDLDTLVVAHSLDVVQGGRELAIGRPRLNDGGGSAWHWRHDLMTGPSTGGARASVPEPGPTGPDSAPDVPVKLRRPAQQSPAKSSEQRNERR